MSDLASVEVTVSGLVQGVFFRDFTLRRASELSLTGYVRNLPGGTAVGIVAEGERKKLEKLIEVLKVGPPRAEVTRVDTTWSGYSGKYAHFSTRY